MTLVTEMCRESMRRVETRSAVALPVGRSVLLQGTSCQIEEMECGSFRIEGMGIFVTRGLAEGLLEFLGMGKQEVSTTKEAKNTKGEEL